MRKRPATPKIPVETGRRLIVRGHPISVRGSVRYFRKESNEELIHQSVLHRGKAKLRVSVQIKHHSTFQMMGWIGWSAHIEVTSVKQAAQFIAELEHSLGVVVSRIGAKFEPHKETSYGQCKQRDRKV